MHQDETLSSASRRPVPSTASLYTVRRDDLYCMRRMAILKMAKCSAELRDASSK